MDDTLPEDVSQKESLISEILYELLRLPEGRQPEAYRKLRELRGRVSRPSTGPLVEPHQDRGQSGRGVCDS